MRATSVTLQIRLRKGRGGDLPPVLRHHPQRGRSRALLADRGAGRGAGSSTPAAWSRRRATSSFPPARPRRRSGRSAAARRSSATRAWSPKASPAPACPPATRSSARSPIRRRLALAEKLGTTRTAAAIDLWLPRLDGAVVAIGNAPTALFRLLELIDAGAPRPAAIIGMPVGFVGAAESKEALIESGLPAIVMRGRKGRQRDGGGGGQCAGERGRMRVGRLYGVGIGPGDPELLTVKATRVIAEAPVVAFFAKAGRRGNARGIVDRWLKPSHVELPLYYPMTTESHFDDPPYREALAAVLRRERGGDRGPSRGGPRRRAAQRRRPALLRLVHASVRPTARALRGDDRAGRLVDLRRLGRGGDGDDLGRRFARRAAGDPAARGADAPPRRSPTPPSS